MTCQPYNPAERPFAAEISASRRLVALVAAVLLVVTFSAAPVAAQVFGRRVCQQPVYARPVYVMPVTNPSGPLPIGGPQPVWVGPVIVDPQFVQGRPALPPANGQPQTVTTNYPPAVSEDAAPLLEQAPGAVRVIITEALFNRLLARSDTDAGPVVDNILGANVTGNQNTNTTLSVDVQPCPQLARLQLELCGTTLNQTIGVTPQAAVRSRGTHDFRVTKQVDFDGLKFSTRSPAAWVTPRLTNEGAATPLTGVPVLGPLSNQIALNEAQRRRPAAEQVVTQRVTDQVAPRFNQEIDQQLSDANVRLQQHVPWLLGAAGLTPTDLAFRSTDRHVLLGLCVPQVSTSERPILPQFDAPTETQESEEPTPDEQPVSVQPLVPPPEQQQPSNRQPILLAPIEPADAIEPAEAAPVDEPTPSEGSAADEGEFTVIRQISDVQDAPAEEPTPAQPLLPSLMIERGPASGEPSIITPPTDEPESVEPTGIAAPQSIGPPPSFVAGESFTLGIHESAINYALQRAPLEGTRVPDRTIDRLIAHLRELLGGTPPAELSLEGLGSEEPEFATIVLWQEAPLSVRFEQGQVLVEAVAAFEPKLTPAVSAQRVQIPFELRHEDGKLRLVPGEVTVEALPGEAGGPLAELARPIIRQQITQRLQPVELPTSLPLSLPGLPTIELTTREVALADGWLMIAID